MKCDASPLELSLRAAVSLVDPFDVVSTGVLKSDHGEIRRPTTTVSLNVRTVEYFYLRIEDSQEKAYALLAQLASEEVSLLAFSAVPFGPNYVETDHLPRPER